MRPDGRRAGASSTEPRPRLADLTTLRVGGPARRLLRAEDEAQLVDAVRAADASGEPVLVLGAGSNLLVSDDGFEGVVVQVATRGVRRQGRTRVTVAAGEVWDDIVGVLVAEGLAGVEAISGVPGLVGATPIQNVGAYGQEVAQAVASVRVLDRASATVQQLSAAACAFTYRNSRFKSRDTYLVLDVTFELRDSDSGIVAYAGLAAHLGVAVGAAAPLAEIRSAVLDLRRAKGMVLDPGDHDTWSAGSFFTNPVLPADQAARLPDAAPRWPEADGRLKVSAAWLIEQAGFHRGYGTGRVGLSTKHTLALTNRGGGTSAELVALAREIRDGVRDRFGVTLVNEPVLVGVTL